MNSFNGAVRVDADHLHKAIAKYEKQKDYIEPKLKLMINKAELAYINLPWWHWFLRESAWEASWEYAIRYFGGQVRASQGGGRKPIQVEEEFVTLGWMDEQEYAMLERVAWADDWEHRTMVDEFKKMLAVGSVIYISPAQAEFVTAFTK